MGKETKRKPLLSWPVDDPEPIDSQWLWDDFLEELTQLIQEVNPEGYWLCKASNFGWRNQSGHAYLEFETGQELLTKVLPNCDCSFNIFRDGNELEIQNFHHDSPTGNEWYTLTPITAEQFEEQPHYEV